MTPFKIIVVGVAGAWIIHSGIAAGMIDVIKSALTAPGWSGGGSGLGGGSGTGGGGTYPGGGSGSTGGGSGSGGGGSFGPPLPIPPGFYPLPPNGGP